MSLIGVVQEILTPKFGFRVPADLDSAPIAMELFRKSTNRLYIVAGELNPDFYGSTFASILRSKLENIPTYKANFLFAKSFGRVSVENPHLANIFAEEQYTNRLFVYQVEQRPRYHFMIFDDSILLEEAPHYPKQPRNVLIKEREPKVVAEYIKHFQDIVEAVRNRGQLLGITKPL